MSKRRTIIPKGMEFYYEQFHFAPAVRVGKMLYCSGQLGWAGPGKTVPADPKEQFKLAFENVGLVLAAAGGLGDDARLTGLRAVLGKGAPPAVAPE